MTIHRHGLAVIAASLLSAFSSGTIRAGTFGVFGFQVDMSANVKDTLQPGNTTVHQDSLPLFNTVEGESASILYNSLGVNGSGRSTNIHDAFASSLADATGDGGAGVSQLIFGSPGGSDPNALRQLFAQSLWTQTFTYTGTFPVDISVHIQVPALQVGLLGVPPRRTGLSATETAAAIGEFDRTITHPDLTIAGGSLEFGMSESEEQIPSGTDLLNIATLQVLGKTGLLTSQAPQFNGDDFEPSFTLNSFSFDLDLGELHHGDILSYVYTLTAQGSTHGFERGYFAFVGDPFNANAIGDNLTFTLTPVTDAAAPEPNTYSLMLAGIGGVFAWRRYSIARRKRRAADIMSDSVLCPAKRGNRPTWSVFTRSCTGSRQSN